MEHPSPILDKVLDRMLLGKRTILPVLRKEANVQVRCRDCDLDTVSLPQLKTSASHTKLAEISPKTTPTKPVLPITMDLPPSRSVSNDENV